MAGLGSVVPTSGGRIVMRLGAFAQSTAEYEVSLLFDGVVWVGAAAIAEEQSSLSGLDDAPQWLVKYANALVRGLAKNRTELGWPRRLTRWRDEPRVRTK